MKKKLFAASMSLAMAFIMMVSSSFAWYTINTSAEITNATVSMGSSKTIEIAKASKNNKTPKEVTSSDTENQFAFGRVVSYGLAEGADALTIPVTFDAGAVKTVSYDTTGRTNGLGTTLAATELQGTSDNGDGYLFYQTTSGAKGAISYVTFLRTNAEDTGGATTVTAAITRSEAIAADLIVKDCGTAVDTAVTNPTAVTVTRGTDGSVTEGKITRPDTFQVEKDHIYRVELVLYFAGANDVGMLGIDGKDGSASVLFTDSAITYVPVTTPTTPVPNP